jgi:hypothetical protein
LVADSPLGSIDRLEKDLWEAADHLRANSKLTSSEYCMPVLGVIFLRHAANRFQTATRQIEADQQTGRMPKRQLIQSDYIKRHALMLPETAHYELGMLVPPQYVAGVRRTVFRPFLARTSRFLCERATGLDVRQQSQLRHRASELLRCVAQHGARFASHQSGGTLGGLGRLGRPKAGLPVTVRRACEPLW